MDYTSAAGHQDRQHHLGAPLGPSLTQPQPKPVDSHAYAVLCDLVTDGSVLVLTGAGMSTAAGIPDYRGIDGRRRVQPMQHTEFTTSATARQRYWARGFLAWQRFSAATPTAGHRALAALDRAELLRGTVTQNVDGLHQRAGSRSVLELHGSLAWVSCLDCSTSISRAQVQGQLELANPDFLEIATEEEMAGAMIRPDGDIEIPQTWVHGFRVPQCQACASDRLKPDVVFFGGAVPADRVETAYQWLDQAGLLLVLGSSLQVMSGYRFVRRAAARQIPVAVVTRGRTRGDAETFVRLDSRLDDVLPRLATDLTGE